MEKEEILKFLGGVEIDDINFTELNDLIKDKFIVVLGYSDDILQLYGAIDEEYGLGKLIVRPKGSFFLLETSLDGCYDEDGNNLDWVSGVYKEFKEIDAIPVEKETLIGYIKGDFGREGFEFETDFPHETFPILEDGVKIFEGLLIDVNDIKNFQYEA